MSLRAVTEMTGGLHELQVRQLKIWPRVLFQDSLRAECEVHAGDGVAALDPSTVKFTVHCKSGKRKPILTDKEATKLLETYVHQLLGDQWIVEVSVVR